MISFFAKKIKFANSIISVVIMRDVSLNLVFCVVLQYGENDSEKTKQTENIYFNY